MSSSQPPQASQGSGVVVKAVVAGFAAALAVSFLVLAATGLLGAQLQQMPPEASTLVGTTLSVVASLGAVLTGGFAAGWIAGRSGALHGALVAVLIVLLLALLLAAMWEAVVIGEWFGPVAGILAQVALGAFGGYLGENVRRRQGVS